MFDFSNENSQENLQNLTSQSGSLQNIILAQTPKFKKSKIYKKERPSQIMFWDSLLLWIIGVVSLTQIKSISREISQPGFYIPFL